MGYQKINIITGWVAFLIAMITYTLTVEPTASFWDCGEFIATAYKLEVPHPPGAPFFLLMGRLFSLFAGDNVEQVAYWVNMLSVVSGGFTILFLFWSITHLARKIVKAEGEESMGQTIAIMGAGMVGAMACTFSDSVWFSAVEAEVYSMSSFFTAFVFWAILKWETIKIESDRNKWLILIAYMMGLSIGVHLLNLVTIPALGLIVYFNYAKEITKKGIIAALILSGAAIIFILIGVIPGIASLVGSMEIIFVNSFGLPFGSGAVFFIVAFVGLLVYAIMYSIKKQKVILNTVLLAFTVIMIGYTSYAIVLIRSNYNTPIDENNPEDIMTYVSYLKREQYGSRPLFHGQYFTADIIAQEQGDPVYMKGEDKYEIKDYKVEYTYDPKHTTILPRMYSKSSNGAHERRYREVTGVRNGERPSFADNISYMFKHQLGFMYFRYFMWNFSGRASDIQNADWVGLAGSFEKLPDEIANNAGRNIYFGLPLLLGLIGMFFHFRKNQSYFWVTLLLFFLTGAALVLYLNSPPIEPRERDYIYAGSYYVFAIWIGLSVLALYDWLGSVVSNKKAVAVFSTVLCLGVPVLMASENWDDHDRSDRYFSVDAAKNYLDSCAPNAILFTGGDNDTFPLWFVQEVLGHRTDVRVIVLSYFNTDWYIEQMMRDAYESKALPFSLTLDHYIQGGPNDYLPYRENPNLKINGPISAKQYLNLIKQEHPILQVGTTTGSVYNSIPAKEFFVNVDQQAAGELEFLSQGASPLARYKTDKLVFKMKGSGLEKKDLAILDLIVNSNFKRPIYFNNTSMNSVNFDVRSHVVQEGLTYRLTPIRNPGGGIMVNADIAYENLINRFNYRQLDNPDVYYNEDFRNFCLNHRSTFNSLARQLLNDGDKERAREVLMKNLELIPDIAVPYDVFSVQQIGLLLAADEKEKALEMAEIIGQRSKEWLEYATTSLAFSPGDQEFQQRMISLQELARVFRASNERELAAEYEAMFNQYRN
ncbi:MAG: DUF2723 domain-containing protein [Cyclobacteriaceae bacterium]